MLLLLCADGQLLKLPANKFTVREREMLIGSGILPREFFEVTKNPFAVGIGACECARQPAGGGGAIALYSVVASALAGLLFCTPAMCCIYPCTTAAV